MSNRHNSVVLDWRKRHPVLIKTMALFLLLTFLLYDITWAQGGTPIWQNAKAADTVACQNKDKINGISIPQHLGKTDYAYSTANGKTIINIQDAHASLSAQHSIVNILDSLATNYNVNLIAVEGSEGYLDTSILRAFPDKEMKKKTCEYLMKEGRMSAGEFFTVVSEKPVALYGIENNQLYKKNVELFRSIMEDSVTCNKHIEALEKTLSNLEGGIYGKELKDLMMQSRLHKAGILSFSKYWKLLSELIEKKGLSVKRYQNITKLLSAMDLEKDINFDKANEERKALIDSLSKGMAKDRLEELVLKSLAFKKGEVSQTEFHTYLVGLAEKENIEAAPYKNLINFTRYISIYETIDIFSLYSEVDSLESAIMERLYTSKDQRTLYDLEKKVSILKGLFNVNLTNDGVEYLTQNRDKFKAEDIASFIRKNYTKHNLVMEFSYDLGYLTQRFDRAIEFYNTVQNRNSAMIRNTIKNMEAEKQSVAALITGGFHSKGLTDLIRNEKVSYLIIMPKFEQGKDRPYIAILTNKKEPYEKLINSGQYQLAVYQMFSTQDDVSRAAMLAIYLRGKCEANAEKDQTELSSILEAEVKAAVEVYTRMYGSLPQNEKDTLAAARPTPEQFKNAASAIAELARKGLLKDMNYEELIITPPITVIVQEFFKLAPTPTAPTPVKAQAKPGVGTTEEGPVQKALDRAYKYLTLASNPRNVDAHKKLQEAVRGLVNELRKHSEQSIPEEYINLRTIMFIATVLEIADESEYAPIINVIDKYSKAKASNPMSETPEKMRIGLTKTFKSLDAAKIEKKAKPGVGAPDGGSVYNAVLTASSVLLSETSSPGEKQEAAQSLVNELREYSEKSSREEYIDWQTIGSIIWVLETVNKVKYAPVIAVLNKYLVKEKIDQASLPRELKEAFNKLDAAEIKEAKPAKPETGTTEEGAVQKAAEKAYNAYLSKTSTSKKQQADQRLIEALWWHSYGYGPKEFIDVKTIQLIRSVLQTAKNPAHRPIIDALKPYSLQETIDQASLLVDLKRAFVALQQIKEKRAEHKKPKADTSKRGPVSKAVSAADDIFSDIKSEDRQKQEAISNLVAALKQHSEKSIPIEVLHQETIKYIILVLEHAHISKYKPLIEVLRKYSETEGIDQASMPQELKEAFNKLDAAEIEEAKIEQKEPDKFKKQRPNTDGSAAVALKGLRAIAEAVTLEKVEDLVKNAESEGLQESKLDAIKRAGESQKQKLAFVDNAIKRSVELAREPANTDLAAAGIISAFENMPCSASIENVKSALEILQKSSKVSAVYAPLIQLLTEYAAANESIVDRVQVKKALSELNSIVICVPEIIGKDRHIITYEERQSIVSTINAINYSGAMPERVELAFFPRNIINEEEAVKFAEEKAAEIGAIIGIPVRNEISLDELLSELKGGFLTHVSRDLFSLTNPDIAKLDETRVSLLNKEELQKIIAAIAKFMPSIVSEKLSQLSIYNIRMTAISKQTACSEAELPNKLVSTVTSTNSALSMRADNLGELKILAEEQKQKMHLARLLNKGAVPLKLEVRLTVEEDSPLKKANMKDMLERMGIDDVLSPDDVILVDKSAVDAAVKEAYERLVAQGYSLTQIAIIDRAMDGRQDVPEGVIFAEYTDEVVTAAHYDAALELMALAATPEQIRLSDVKDAQKKWFTIKPITRVDFNQLKREIEQYEKVLMAA